MPAAYDILQHGTMIGDRRRLDAYLEAIRRSVRPGDVVVDLGSGTGVFAVAACRAGARRVYAIEADGIVQVARDVVADNHCSSSVEFVEDLSTNVTLPELADVVVLDVRSVLPDDQIPVALDAQCRLVREGGRIVPATDTIWAAVASAPDLYDRLPLRQVATRRSYNCRVSVDALLTDPQRVLTIDYGAFDRAEVRSSVAWIVPRSATAHGFVAWFDSILCEGVELSNHPSAPPLLYGQAYFPWPEPVALVEGQTVRLDCVGRPAASGYSWSWTTSIFQPGSADRPIFRFAPQASASAWLDADSLLVLSAVARIDRDVLELISTGGLSVAEIAHEIQDRYPTRFIRFGDALTWAGRVSSLYG